MRHAGPPRSPPTSPPQYLSTDCCFPCKATTASRPKQLVVPAGFAATSRRLCLQSAKGLPPVWATDRVAAMPDQPAGQGNVNPDTPGWYTHPGRPAEEWYWNGGAWTE